MGSTVSLFLARPPSLSSRLGLRPLANGEHRLPLRDSVSGLSLRGLVIGGLVSGLSLRGSVSGLSLRGSVFGLSRHGSAFSGFDWSSSALSALMALLSP